MKVSCPGCGRSLSVPESAIGRTIACPACRSPVKIEESLELAPAPPPPSAGPPADPMGPRPSGPYLAPGACPTCGFPVARGVEICTRCGTDLKTGRQDEKLVGYRPSIFRKIFGRTGWILTGAVTLGIVIGLWFLVGHLRSWGKAVMEENTQKGAAEARSSPAPAPPPPSSPAPIVTRPESKPSPQPSPAPPPAGKAEAAPPGPAAPARALPVPSDPASRFEEAFALLVDPVPATQADGLRRLISIGPPAVELLGKRYSDSQDPHVRAACVRGLGGFRTQEAASHLAVALADPEERIRDAAVAGLSAMGKLASDATGKALGSDSPLARAAAARVAGLLSLKEYAHTVAKLMLSDTETEVRFEAARAFGGALSIGTESFEALISAMGDANIDVSSAAAESLSLHADSVDQVVKSLPQLAEAGPERLVFAAIPILASRRTDVAETLAERLCAQKPTPKVVEFSKKILALPNPAARMEAISAAHDLPELHAAVGLCLLDPDDRVRRSALSCLSSVARGAHPLPFVVALGSRDVEFAFACARALEGRAESELLGALRRAAKGVHPQRRALAAGILAMKGEAVLPELLRAAALGRPALPPPLAGWAAYAYSFVAPPDQVKALLASAPAPRDARDRAFLAAAGARHGDADSLKRLRALVQDRTAGEARMEAVRVLGALGDKDSAGAIMAMVRDPDPALVAAAAKAAAASLDAEVMMHLVRRIPDLPQGQAQEVKSAILSVGSKVEPSIVAALDDPDVRVRIAGVELLGGLGRKASRKGIEKTAFLLRDRRLDRVLHDAAFDALTAMTGIRPGEDWTWKQWAKALNLRLEDEIASVPMERVDWGWLSMEVPASWRKTGGTAGDDNAPGSPLVTVHSTRDPEDPKAGTPPAGRRFQGAQALRKQRIHELTTAVTTVTQAGRQVEKREPKEGVSATLGLAFNVGLATVAPARVVDKPSDRTTYWLFVVASGKRCSWYGEISMSVATSEYQDYAHLFETRMQGSLKIHQDKVQ